jgi:hypothetical protein
MEYMLRRVRIGQGKTLRQLSAATAIAGPDLSRLERGLLPAYPGWRARLARALRMSADELFRVVEG